MRLQSHRGKKSLFGQGEEHCPPCEQFHLYAHKKWGWLDRWTENVHDCTISNIFHPNACNTLTEEHAATAASTVCSMNMNSNTVDKTLQK